MIWQKVEEMRFLFTASDPIEKVPFRYIKSCLFVAFLTTIFVFFYSFGSNEQRVVPKVYLKQPRPLAAHLPSKLPKQSTASYPKKEFLVYSKNCRIPDVSPWHPSIRRLISRTYPLDCSKEYKALSLTEGNVLKILPQVAKERNISDMSCCYRTVFRNENGHSDDDIGFGTNCIELKSEVVISDEFIEVNCRRSNGRVFYKNFHSFIHRKPKVEERCSRVQKDTERYSILIVGVDAMSRLNMHRQLNDTAKFLLDELGAVEMYGFNKVGDNTFPNLIPLLLGYDERELRDVCWNSTKLPLDKCNFLWNQFSTEGYRTLYAEDTPGISSFNYVKRGFYHQPTDYYFRQYILAYERALGRDRPLNCYLCVGSVSETEAVLQWTQKFATEFSNDPYFAFVWINSLTHDFLNLGSAGDHMYKNFFKSLHTDQRLENTVIMVMGDHGMRWGKIRQTYVGRLEVRLPMLLVVLPPKFKRNHPEATAALKLNAHRLTTPFDLHATLKNLLNINEPWVRLNTSGVPPHLAANYSRRAYSLFHPIPENRSCKEASIDEQWCTCETQRPIDRKKAEIKSASNILVSTLNHKLKPQSKVCSVLHLHNILESRIWARSMHDDPLSPLDSNIYTIVFQTMPGNAIFEGTIRFNPKNNEHEILGETSRLNLYGNQSSCVHDVHLLKYCFCAQNGQKEKKLKQQSSPADTNTQIFSKTNSLVNPQHSLS